MELTADALKLLELLSSNQKLTAMVAPSFPVDFTKKGIIGALKTLGFDKVSDHSLAIFEVNKAYEEFFQTHQDKITIAANCPATVNLIKTKFPQLVKYLPNIPSPMGMNAKLCKGWWPQNLNIFIGPCIAKKIEAKNYSDVTLALTYKEIQDICIQKGIDVTGFENQTYDFDSPKKEGVGIFPASGGVKATINTTSLGCRKIIVGDEIPNLIALFEKLSQGLQENRCEFYDVLACPGGCIGGPGVISTIPKEQRKEKLVKFIAADGVKPVCSQVDTTV